MTETTIKHGNFDSLAGDYAQFRPGYAPSIVPAVLSLVGRPGARSGCGRCRRRNRHLDQDAGRAATAFRHRGRAER